MKKTLSLFISLLITLSCFSYTVLAEENVKVVLDGQLIEFDVPAQIINGRTMVPVRKIFEELGMFVDWDGEAQKVTANKKGVLIELTINDTTVYRNTVEQEIDVPAQIINGRTLVPVRVVSEYAGADVLWEGETNTVYINSTDNIQHINWNDLYEYYGEGENNEATGYGILYNKTDGSIRQMGKYINSQITVGTFYFDGGNTFVGNFENGRPVYGTHFYSNGERFVGEFKDVEIYDGTYYYNNGDFYVGEFKDGNRHGQGTYNYANGSFHMGEWKNGQPNGYGEFYESVEDVKYAGNYIDGKRNGDFIVKDFFLDKTYYATYVNGVYVDENYIQSQNIKKYEEEHAALISWAEKKMDEIYAEGDKIYNQILNKVDTSMEYGSNLDSFAAANAMRQQAALIEQYKKTAETEKAKYLAEQLELLADFVQQQENELKIKYNIK